MQTSISTSIATGLLIILLSLSTPVHAAGDADAGKRTAEQWCSSCHLIGTSGRSGDAAPPFIVLANDPSKTETYLKGWISNPHPPMPNFNLTRAAIDDLVAYIRSLRTKRGAIQRQ